MKDIVIKSHEKTEKIVFVFHGYGADMHDLESVAQSISDTMPNADVYLVNGIESCEFGSGYQWFSLQGEDIQDWESAFSKNIDKIESYISEIMASKNLTYNNVVLCGFSQGAMVSLGIGIKNNALAVVAFSGLMLNPISCIGSTTKVLLTHGALDDVIPISAMNATQEALANSNVNVSTIISDGLQHGIDDKIIKRTIEFLKELN